jgi:hypothetical protein
MKKILCAGLLVGSISATFAQDFKEESSFHGSWVVESNVNVPRQQTIKFYNSNSELIFEDKVSGWTLRYQNERIKKALNQALEIALQDGRTAPGTFLAVLRKNRPNRSCKKSRPVMRAALNLSN